MKRELGTALSVLGLLAIGTGAAALNVRMLHSPGGEANRLTLQTTSNRMMANVTAQPTVMPEPPSMPQPPTAPQPPLAMSSSAPVTRASDAPVAAVGAPVVRVTTAPKSPVASPSGLSPIGSTSAVSSEDDDDAEDSASSGSQSSNREGSEQHNRIQATPEQMNLLRVAAMVGVPPELARAAARGESGVDPMVVNLVKAAAAQIGASLDAIAKVELPAKRVRATGGDQLRSGNKSDD